MFPSAFLLGAVALIWCWQDASASFTRGSLWNLRFTLDVVSPNYYLRRDLPSVLACGSLCMTLPICLTYGFNSDSKTCWLYDHIVVYASIATAAPKTRYFWSLSPRCPTELNYTLEADACYKIHRETVLLAEARRICSKEGGSLFIADTAAKVTLLKEKITNRVWLGGSDSDEEGTWRWEDGNLLDRTSALWYIGQPDNFNGIQDLLVMDITGKLDDLDSFQPAQTACEIFMQKS